MPKHFLELPLESYREEPRIHYMMSEQVTIKRLSPISFKIHEMTLPISEAEYLKREQARNRGMLIQTAYPELTPDQREFILSGITPDEWEATFGGDSED